MSDTSKNSKRIANCTLAFSAGLAALIFSTRFFPIKESYIGGIILAVAGIAAIIGAYISWRKV